MLNRRQLHASSEEGDVDEIIKERLPYLKLDSKGVNVFAKDLVQRHIISVCKLRLIEMVVPVCIQVSLHIGVNAQAHHFKHSGVRIVSMYLLSTDYFQNGYDESKIVCHLEFYAPFEKLKSCQTTFT